MLPGVAEPRCQQAEAEEEAEGCRAGRGSRAVELENATDDHRQPVGWLVALGFFPFGPSFPHLTTGCWHSPHGVNTGGWLVARSKRQDESFKSCGW